MALVFIDMAMSLDGFVSGPEGGDDGLHDWYFAPAGEGQTVLDDLLASIGAMILGRTVLGEADGFETPYAVPHFVLTHNARPSTVHGGASFHFVSGGPAAVLREARAAAGEKDVCIAGGASTARQFLEAGLVDELRVHLVPRLLGRGRRLFGEHGIVDLEVVQVQQSPRATHLRYRILKPSARASA